MTKTLNALVIASALSFVTLILGGWVEAATNGPQSLRLANHDHPSCLLVKSEILCASQAVQPAVRLLSYDLH